MKRQPRRHHLRAMEGSPFTGVSRGMSNGYEAQVKFQGQRVYRKWFRNELKAAIARDEVSWELYGDKANLNFPERFR